MLLQSLALAALAISISAPVAEIPKQALDQELVLYGYQFTVDGPESYASRLGNADAIPLRIVRFHRANSKVLLQDVSESEVTKNLAELDLLGETPQSMRVDFARYQHPEGVMVLGPYLPTPGFVARQAPVEGFLSTTERNSKVLQQDGRTPITFRVSSKVPNIFRQGVRDAADYWNGILGRELIHLEMAASGMSPIDPSSNNIAWAAPDESGGAMTQVFADPRTGEILHANITLFWDIGWEHRKDSPQDLLDAQNGLRFTLAHELGHALGLAHHADSVMEDRPQHVSSLQSAFPHDVEMMRELTWVVPVQAR